MQWNTCLLMSCNRRKRVWLTRVSPIVKREVLRATVRAKNTKRGKQNMHNKRNLKLGTESSTVLQQNPIISAEVHDRAVPIKNNDRCLRCGRKLKNPTARMLGYGPICYAKLQQENSRRLFLI